MAIVGSNVTCNQFLSYCDCYLEYDVKWNIWRYYNTACPHHRQPKLNNLRSLLLPCLGKLAWNITVVLHPLALCSGWNTAQCLSQWPASVKGVTVHHYIGHCGWVACHQWDCSLALIYPWGHPSRGKMLSQKACSKGFFAANLHAKHKAVQPEI